MSSSPAIMRSAVVLPHPDGPTSTSSSPSLISSESSLTASTPFANRLVSSFRTISATRSALEGAGHQTAHEVAAEQHVDDQGGQRRQYGGGHLQVVGGDERAGRVVQRHRHRPGGGIGDEEDREQEVVPDRGELPDRSDYERGSRERQDHRPVRPQHAG